MLIIGNLLLLCHPTLLHSKSNLSMAVLIAYAVTNTSTRANQEGNATSTLWDASPIPTSTIGPIPTGSFSLQLGPPSEMQSGCLTNSTQRAAWACNMSTTDPLSITVSYQSGTNKLGAYISSMNDNGIEAGMSTPSTMWSPMQLVTDIDDPSKGPAYQFQAFYPKMVVLSPSAFEPGGPSKRDALYSGKHRLQKREELAAGSQPWFCYWNNTLIEGFIYAKDDAKSTSTSSPSSTTAISGSASPTTTCTSSTPSAPTMPVYPYVVKIEERRIPGSQGPYCQRMQILDNGQAGYLPESFCLDESDPGRGGMGPAPGLSSRDAASPSSCHCQWYSGGS